jgi:hypothetical protein
MFLGLNDVAFLAAVSAPAQVVTDPDANAYILAVEAADGQALETAVRAAINDFVVGCKADGIWAAIKASCILAGARTLTGALVPLAGTAPTNFNFEAGDYDRKTGLVGDGSTKWLDSNRAGNADPLSNYHASTVVTQRQSTGFGSLIASRPAGLVNSSQILDVFTPPARFQYIDRGSSPINQNTTGTGFVGMSRLSGNLTMRFAGSTASASQAAAAQVADNWNIFARTEGTQLANARLAFYSIGESLDLALLDARVTALINAFAAVIP